MMVGAHRTFILIVTMNSVKVENWNKEQGGGVRGLRIIGKRKKEKRKCRNNIIALQH